MIIISGHLARETITKQVNVKDGTRAVLNNCIFVKGKGEKDIPVSISAWDVWADHIAKHYKKGDLIHIVGEETPDIFKTGDNKIDILGCVVKAVVDAQLANHANIFLKSLATEVTRLSFKYGGAKESEHKQKAEEQKAEIEEGTCEEEK